MHGQLCETLPFYHHSIVDNKNKASLEMKTSTCRRNHENRVMTGTEPNETRSQRRTDPRCEFPNLAWRASLALFVAFVLSRLYCNRHADNDHPHGNVLHALSGAMGSAISLTVLHPFETTRTRLQVDPTLNPRSSFLLIYEIAKREGGRGLYRGWCSLVVASASSNFVYFFCFRGWTRRWTSFGFFDDSSFRRIAMDLIGGYLAGVVVVLVTNPLWLANTRLKLQGVHHEAKEREDHGRRKHRGIFDCLLAVSREEGILALWNGTFASIVLAINPAIQFGVYETLKRHRWVLRNAAKMMLWSTKSLSTPSDADFVPAEPFFNALLAKFVATIVTYPLQVVQTQRRAGIHGKREEGDGSRRSYSRPAVSCRSDLMDTVRQRGFRGLYRGLESKLIQTCLNAAIMFAVYEKLVSLWKEPPSVDGLGR